MAKKVGGHSLIESAEALITSREETRAGFIAMALEKNYMAVPYVEQAKALKTLASSAVSPLALLEMEMLRSGLLTASGLSEKSLNYLTEDDKTIAIKGLIENFLEPAGTEFVDELVYRFLLTKGDALGGKARNLAGTLGERKFLRTLISVFNIAGISYRWKDGDSNTWLEKPDDDTGIEKRIKALYWKGEHDRLLVLNVNVPMVNKNVDVILLEAKEDEYLKSSKDSIIYQAERYVVLGELKGGIDPAGADEHWKTANSALNRIRASFSSLDLSPQLFFIGAAIENAMAQEIYQQLQKGSLSQAANLTKDSQLTAICGWLAQI